MMMLLLPLVMFSFFPLNARSHTLAGPTFDQHMTNMWGPTYDQHMTNMQDPTTPRFSHETCILHKSQHRALKLIGTLRSRVPLTFLQAGPKTRRNNRACTWNGPGSLVFKFSRSNDSCVVSTGFAHDRCQHILSFATNPCCLSEFSMLCHDRLLLALQLRERSFAPVGSRRQLVDQFTRL